MGRLVATYLTPPQRHLFPKKMSPQTEPPLYNKFVAARFTAALISSAVTLICNAVDPIGLYGSQPLLG